jgi:uncharacterized Zn finger protein
MSAAKCPVCGGEAGDRVEGVRAQSGSEVVLLICQRCGTVFTEKRGRPPVPLQMFRPIRRQSRRRSD